MGRKDINALIQNNKFYSRMLKIFKNNNYDFDNFVLWYSVGVIFFTISVVSSYLLYYENPTLAGVGLILLVIIVFAVIWLPLSISQSKSREAEKQQPNKKPNKKPKKRTNKISDKKQQVGKKTS